MKQKAPTFDVIVIGGGHAGIEAAHAAAKMGSQTLLLTLTIDTIGLMPCNPALGGIGKGHLIYEVSALGGLMPELATQTYIQVRMLNTSKGPAVQGLRVQIDKDAYSALSQKRFQEMPNLTLAEGIADTILTDKQGAVYGLTTEDGTTYRAPVVIITTGTFLNGKVFIGDQVVHAGRRNEQAVTGLARFLDQVGLKLGRLKTGTPPRLLHRSIDFSQMTFQEPDKLNYLFEFYPHTTTSTHPCYITRTNKLTHAIIENNLERSAMYNGNISGIGPRYCPSIEDKITRFPLKDSHHVFVEPEGVNSKEVYPNGISTSLPLDVQVEYVRSIKGFEKAIISKPGYAVEYDIVVPHQLKKSLEVKKVPGLFLAGQINGTTGYEEAAAQGIMAGINGHLSAHKLPSFILDRTESYIGVMISDLTSMGVDEPYRMFTSRAEHRLILRQDNVFLRLTDKAYKLGLIDETLYQDFLTEKKAIESTLKELYDNHLPSELMRIYGTNEKEALPRLQEYNETLSERAALVIHAEIRYEPYIKRELKEVERAKYYQALTIPTSFQYKDLPGLSKELQEKLSEYQPANIAQAALIPGMTPAAVSLLIFRAKEAANQ